MPYCSNCKTYIPDGIDVCPQCGTKDSRYTNHSTSAQTIFQGQQNISKEKKSFINLIKKIIITKDVTYEFRPDDISKNSNVAVLAYLGPLVIIPLITSRKSKFAMFHCCQGIINMVFGILYVAVLSMISNVISNAMIILLFIPCFLLLIAFPTFQLFGIVHALKGKAITLPIFGHINLMRVFFKKL